MSTRSLAPDLAIRAPTFDDAEAAVAEAQRAFTSLSDQLDQLA